MSGFKQKTLAENLAVKDVSSRYETASYSDGRKPDESIEEKMTRMNLQRSQESSESVPTRQEHVATDGKRNRLLPGASETKRRLESGNPTAQPEGSPGRGNYHEDILSSLYSHFANVY